MRRAAEAICAVEPIHRPGTIQPHGMLMAFDPVRDMAVVGVSRNLDGLPGVDFEAGASPFTRPLAGLLGGEFEATLRRRAASNALGVDVPWETTLSLSGASTRFEATSHSHGGHVIVELEPTVDADAETALVATRQLQHAIARLRVEQGGLLPLAAAAVRNIRLMTGFERVLLYRFDADWNGEAIAEDQVDGWPQSLLGLKFPASDIPAQARALYTRSLIRWVPSRDAEAVRLVLAPDMSPSHQIDLSHARLRSLSPTHMQYHRNMGVDGTMSLSVIVGGALWGLVVCHHRKPHRTSAAQRAAAAALADAFAQRIGPAERAGTETRRRAEQRRIAQLVGHMAQIDDLQIAMTTGEVTVQSLFDAGGAAIVQGDRIVSMGKTPAVQETRRLSVWLRENVVPSETAVDRDVFATAQVATLVPDWGAQEAVASGVMAIFLTDDRSDMLLWFRPERLAQVSWGGNPHDKESVPLDGGAVLPRRSFERWTETMHGSAEAWADWELEAAALLRHSITEVIVRSLRRITALNEQLRQSQKMEAVGQLTGGVAHDFNNLLGGIIGSIELARTRVAQGRTEGLDRYLAAALGAANRAASLTNRLLAFSRQQTLDPKPTDVNRLIASMAELVRRTVGPEIDLECVTAAGLWTVICDGNQLENALLNLSLNARDAMAEAGSSSGRLTIEAVNARLDDAYAERFGITPGHYVAVSVSDTGRGMSAETVNRAFEPFFTTKPIGQGTGLGLSMVYGFAKQSGGQARIYSEEGQGTTVRLYLPRHLGGAEEVPDVKAENDVRLAPGAARVLVVDDEPVLRMLICEVLREQGFDVLEARDGREALGVLGEIAAGGEAAAGEIDLLITDVGLPGGMNGRQVAEAARVIQAGLKVLFITGYAENAALSGGVLDPITQVLTKPFDIHVLSAKAKAMVA